jgi:hypothetical protein
MVESFSIIKITSVCCSLVHPAGSHSHIINLTVRPGEYLNKCGITQNLMCPSVLRNFLSNSDFHFVITLIFLWCSNNAFQNRLRCILINFHNPRYFKIENSIQCIWISASVCKRN